MRAPEKTMIAAKRLRSDMSLPEVLMWEQLRRMRLDGLRFRRQHPVGHYVLDFYCTTSRVAIEVDGAHHYVQEGLARDRVRDAWLIERGIRVLRIPASDILDRHRFDGVLVEIAEAARPSGETGSRRTRNAPPPALRATSPASQGRTTVEAARDLNPPPFTGEVARRAGGGAHAEISMGGD